MKNLSIFAAGVVTGWVLRSGFDSFRDVAVRGLSTWYDVNDRARRFVAVEREYVEDLMAEARARFAATRARRGFGGDAQPAGPGSSTSN
jgi:hypothetical protein